MSPKQPGYVYLFRNEFNYTKIGHAINPHNRAKTIESSSGLTIVESYMSPVCFNHVEIEGALKRQFSDYRKKGEWFDIEFDTVKTALNSYFPETGTPAIKPIIAIANQAISDNQDEPTVNARELHAFLEVNSKFADWIKNRINEYEFIDGQDYTSFSKILESGGRTIEYFISLDMAKELSMVERTAKGKEARQYFIACEKALKQGKPVLDNDLRNVIYTVVVQALEDISKPKRFKTQTTPKTYRFESNPQYMDWLEIIRQWLLTIPAQREFTLMELAREALGLKPNDITHAAKSNIGCILHSLGYVHFRKHGKGVGRHYFYVKGGVK